MRPADSRTEIWASPGRRSSAAIQRAAIHHSPCEYEPVTARGDSGFRTASVVDPFGNILGVMHNPHYLEMLEARTRA